MTSRTSFNTQETICTNTSTSMVDKCDGGNAKAAPTQTGGWKTLNNMTIKRGMSGCVCINDHQFLVLGGSEDFDDEDSHLSSCEYYDSNTGAWNRPGINIPAARSGFGAVCYGDRIFVMGGMTDPETYRSDLLSIDVGGDLATLSPRAANAPKTWDRLPPMKHPRAMFAYVLHSNHIYIFGGVDENREALDTVERYNIETKRWQQLPNMPLKRMSCAAGVIGDRIYVVGGEDINEKESASTDVFNVSKQQWDSFPAVPDMNESRGMLSVVVVDRFILAIGGGDENGNLLSTIEILDTQRNAWSQSRTRMQQGNCYQAAGYMKGTKELIIAGGANEKAVNVTYLADSIHFENELLPLRFRVQNRGQKIIGDMDHGNDQLGVGTIAKALAELLVFKDLQPPFVMGILGKPGQGKTYFSNLMLQHIINIQKQPLDKLVRNTFVGHIYVVKFDAWTFSKGSIFSSFIYQIFKTLNEQLQFEEEMGDTILESGDVSTIEVFRDLSTGKGEHLIKHTQKIRETYLSVKKNGDRPSERLLKVMNASYKQDQEDLRQIKNEIDKIRTKRIQKQARCALKDVERLIVEEAQKTALQNALEEKLIPEDDRFIDDLIENFETIDDYNNLIKEIRNTKWWNYRFRVSNIPPFAWICSSFFLVLSCVLFLVFKEAALITLSGLVCFSFPVVGNFTTVSNQLDRAIDQLETQTATNDDLEVGSFDNEDLIELKCKEERKKEIENRTLALKGCSLRDTIATKIDAKEYENNVGVVHKVQQNLQHLSDTMLNRSYTDVMFPRGDPRIVLFVEDLDRCEPSVVVEVIEALQLLVKTKLFVSILAIDPRYATLSLEKHYKGILDTQTPLSGMDTFEKIVQIPFCLPGVGQNYVDAFVKSQIDIEEPEHASESESLVINVDDTRMSISDVSSISSIGRGTQVADDFQVPHASNFAERQENEALPTNRVLFTEEERTMVAETLKLFGLAPRSMRRNINVFKVLSVIWNRDSQRFRVDFNLKRATLFLMLLSSEESTREVTCAIFQLMELGMVKYHRVMQNEEGSLQNENNLANLFKTELLKRDRSFAWNFVFSSGNEAKKNGTLVAHIEEYLTAYKWTSVKEWNEIASKFLLARCFSFSHLVPKNSKTRQGSLGMGARRRMNHRETDSRWNYVDFSGGIFNGDNESSMDYDGMDSDTGRTGRSIHDLRWKSSPHKSSGAIGVNSSPNGTNDTGSTSGHCNGHNGGRGGGHSDLENSPSNPNIPPVQKSKTWVG